MKKFKLQFFFQLSEIGSASGIIYHNNSLFVISDNSSYLYEYSLEKKKLHKIALFEYSQENIPKINKFDFEALTKKGNKLYLFGSGSTSSRNKRISYNLQNKKIKEKDVTSLYTQFKYQASLNDCELNIEGAFHHNYKWYFFQRGNGQQSRNGIFIYNQKEIHFHKINLPKLQNIEASFTDAILVDNEIYFLAAVENTTSTYDDGEVLGSYIGCIALNTLQVNFTELISSKNKFEGLTLYKKSDSEISFLLCEDNDTTILESNIYELIVEK